MSNHPYADKIAEVKAQLEILCEEMIDPKAKDALLLLLEEWLSDVGRRAVLADVKLVSGILEARMARPKKAPASNGAIALSARERELVRLICSGRTSKEAALVMKVSTKTAETHRANAMKKVGVDNAVKLTLWAIANGLVEVTGFGQGPLAVEPAAPKKSRLTSLATEGHHRQAHR